MREQKPDRSVEDLLSTALADVGNGWSIGTFGAIAEFRRDADEDADVRRRDGSQQVITARGAIGINVLQHALPVAYETLASDGETWGQAIAFCLPSLELSNSDRVICKGTDAQSLQPSTRTELLFDLGVGRGHVTLSVRVAELTLIKALRGLEGKALFGSEGVLARSLLLQVSPPRIALSPLGRIEVYSPIPSPGARSPSGPHTHLLPKLIAGNRSHSANAPIPQGMQSVLNLHPTSPWRDPSGERTAFDVQRDDNFQALLGQFGLADDKAVRANIEAAVLGGVEPEGYAWPATRRARTQARITLRRLAQRLGVQRLAPWRTRFDGKTQTDADAEPGEAGESAD